MRPQVCISNIKTPKSVVQYWDPRSGEQILRPQVNISITETSGLQFKYRVPTGVEVPSQLKTFELYQKSESETLEIFICLSWQLAVKVKGSTYCHWDEKFRNQQWKCELWAHSRWTTWIYLPTSCGFYQGDLHLSWHAGDHHWNHILSCLVLFYLHHSPFFSCLALIKNFGPSRSKHTTKLREHLPKRKKKSFGHCPNYKIQYIYLSLTAEKDVQVARERGRER